MKLISVALRPFYGDLFLRNKIFSIDNGSNIFFGLKEAFRKSGININTFDVSSRSSYYIYCDVPYPWQFSQLKLLAENKKKNVLFCFESPIINPFSHQKYFHSFFSKVYTWDDSIVDNKKYFKFNIPQQFRGLETKKVKFADKKSLVLINSNKQSPQLFKMISPYKSDLYKERVRILDYYEKHKLNLDLYGYGWNSRRKYNLQDFFGYKKYSNFKGPAVDKYSILSRYKFSICFENSIAPGYISEKIIDCFKARCLPVYLGAPNIGKYFDKAAFIDFREFSGNYGRLYRYLESMTEKEYESRILVIERLLSSKRFLDNWFEDGFKKVVLRSISSK